MSSISLPTAQVNKRSEQRMALMWGVMITLAAAQLLLQLPLLTKSDRHITTLIAIDDTYYYLLPAWNLKTLGFVTFDGINPTNGVQLLWFALLAALSPLVGTKGEFLRLAVALCILCNVLSYLVLARIGQLLRSPLLAIGLALLWCGQTFLVKRYLWAMENSLHALIFWCVLWQVVVFFVRLRKGEPPNLWGLTLVLILNAWTRLDSALFSVVLYGYCLFAWYRVYGEWQRFWYNHAKSILMSVLVAGSAFAVQLLSFRWMGGSYLPVSALVKTSEHAWRWDGDTFATLMKYVALSLPPELLPDWPDAALVAVGAGLLTGLALLFYRGRKTEGPHAESRATARAVWLGLLLCFIAYHIVVWVTGARYEGYFTWYRSPLYLFWIFSAALFLCYGVDWVGERWPFSEGGGVNQMCAWAAGVLFVGIVLLTGWRYTHSPLLKNDVPHHLYSVRYDIAVWINDEFPPDVVLAAWNAGQMGYFSDRSVVNLDGLINSAAYYERVLAGDLPLQQYLQETGVALIVDYEDNPLTRSLPLVYEFPQVDERTIKIWRVP